MQQIIALLFCLILLAGCRPANTRSANTGPNVSAAAEYRRIPATEANRMMGESRGFILLDVRTLGEYTQRRIEGAILIPGNELRSRAETELPDKNTLILVYCQSGVRSANAARTLAALGYVNVYDFGGISGWPYETVND